MIDLKPFCSKYQSSRFFEPFSIGEFTYATNGAICVRVPRQLNIPENPLTSEVGNFAYWIHEHNQEWFDLPDYDKAKLAKKCSDCNGTGTIEICPECDGEGEIEFENGYHDYTCECETCDGDGVIPSSQGDPCEECNGTGLNLTVPVPYQNGLLNLELLEKIKDLPGIRLGRLAEPTLFIFNQGEGLIMPMEGDK